MPGIPQLLAQSSVRSYLEFEPLFPMSEWWQLLVVVLFGVASVALIIFMYLRDSVELSAGVTTTLVVLRLLAFVGMLAFFLNPTLRTERKIVKSSRLPVLVDTSLSMGLRDTDATSVPAAASRIEQVVAEIPTLLATFQKQHDVVVYRFDEQSKPVEIASFTKVASGNSPADEAEALAARRSESVSQARSVAIMAGVLFGCSLLLGVLFFVARAASGRSGLASWVLLASILCLVASVAAMAVANLTAPDVPLMATLGFDRDADDEEDQAKKRAEEAAAAKADEKDPDQIAWKDELRPRGTETRMGEAIRYVVNKERGGPIAGVVVFSDGRNNAGITHTTAIAVANEARIPVYTVGIGSKTRPANVRVVDIEAPKRVHPGDDFTITGLIQSYGMPGRRVKVELFSKGSEDEAEQFEEDQLVSTAEDGKEAAAEFTVTPTDEGRRIYIVRVDPAENDHDPRDNQKTAVVEVVDRQTRILLLAGGPTREFRFLRSQLHRDKEVALNVLLQSSPATITEEANEIHEFPETADELFKYDCIVAFDPDWRELTKDQIDLLERWVAEQAGGLIVVVGPVFTPEWTRAPRGDDRMDTIRGLYPVSFFSQGSATIKLGRFDSEDAFPLKFTREGRSSEFLWLEDSSVDSEALWNEFKGVYGYYAVNEPKAGATVYARFSDPETATGRDDELPIYMAGQFYGAGRVFFQASGELWRIRALEDKYFERYYTKLTRWISQGRLLRDSRHGVLLVDKDRCLLGDQVEVRAILTDAQHLPLTDKEVNARLVQPDSTDVALTLRRVVDGAREGTFAAQFAALQEGDYTVALMAPGSEDPELLTQQVRVRIPDLEIERPELDDALLTEVASKTTGAAFFGMNRALDQSGTRASLTNVIQPQDQSTYLPGTPNTNFTKVYMGWLLAFICGVLAVEWLIRRLSKLA